jgi:hypothetical protein
MDGQVIWDYQLNQGVLDNQTELLVEWLVGTRSGCLYCQKPLTNGRVMANQTEIIMEWLPITGNGWSGYLELLIE